MDNPMTFTVIFGLPREKIKKPFKFAAEKSQNSISVRI